MYTYIYVYICICIYIYIYTYTYLGETLVEHIRERRVERLRPTQATRFVY